MNKNKLFFLISFIPALAYWYLESHYSLEIALMGGVALAIIEFILEKYFTGEVHTISKFNLILIIVLGGLGLWAKEGIWFKLQPSFTGWVMGSFLLYRYYKKDSLMYEMMKMINPNPPPVWTVLWMERNMGVFMFIYGTWMSYVAIKLSTANWLFYKTGGFYIAFAIFSLVQFFVLRKKLMISMAGQNS